MYLDRRELLKIGGASMAGLAVSSLDLPFLSLKPALATALSDDAWCFGVMADTQWPQNTGGEPASCAVTIIDALNQKFIEHGCKFVVQVGDLVDKEVVDGVRTLPTREAHCQALYEAGIGFYPVRGNHEATKTAAAEIQALFPQNMGAGEHALAGATNFTYPMDKLKGLSYSFDYKNIRCVFIDQFTRLDGTGTTNNNLLDQIDWVETTLTSKSSNQHAFVLAHKNLIGQNHKDVISGGNLAANADARNRFIQIMDANGVGYYMGGHDHMHHRSIVTDSAKQFNVDQIICSSNSYKFYTPASGDDGREIPVCQELYTIGFYIVTVDGPRVTVDFYSASHKQDYGDFELVNPPSEFNFYLRERFGYSLNGDKFAIERNGALTEVSSTNSGYVAKVLSGANGNTETDYLNRQLYKTINTGWAESAGVDNATSPIFCLWGMADNLSLYDGSLTGFLPDADEPMAKADTFALSMSYDASIVVNTAFINAGHMLAIYSKNTMGNWVNAVDLNIGGRKRFVLGSWKSTYPLGTYGIDPATHTVWAVLNSASAPAEFVVVKK
jgi:hypothetical protein